MTASDILASAQNGRAAQRVLKMSGALWFLVAAAGQWTFVYYILAAYTPRTLSGDLSRWDETGLIVGHVPGDGFGNLMFAAHVFLAAVITFGGTMQLIPALRSRFPALHRWNGRLFMITAIILAAGGLWMTWFRDARLSDIGAIGIALNGVLILAVVPLTTMLAMRRKIDAHRRWAMRLFILVNGVWFFRLFMMGWIFVWREPLWMNSTLDAPYQLFASFACYLLPLAGLELYFRATASQNAAFKLATASAVAVFSGLMAMSAFAAWMMMWSPHV